jgi:phage head maturation protease
LRDDVGIRHRTVTIDESLNRRGDVDYLYRRGTNVTHRGNARELLTDRRGLEIETTILLDRDCDLR